MELSGDAVAYSRLIGIEGGRGKLDLLFNERSRIAELALACRLPTAVGDLEMVRAGGLIFYSSSIDSEEL